MYFPTTTPFATPVYQHVKSSYHNPQRLTPKCSSSSRETLGHHEVEQLMNGVR
jgi:hypothetical protein